MIPRERFLRALRLKEVDRPPVLSPNQTATVEQMDNLGIYFPDAYSDAHKMADLASAAWEQAGLEGIGVPFCQTVEAEIFGLEIKWGRRKTDIPEAPFKGYATPEGVEVPENFLERGRIPVVLEAIEILRERYGEQVPIMGHVIGAFSLAAHLANMEKILKMSIKNPTLVKEFTNLGLEAIAEYANAMLERGADAIVIENMFASVDIMGVRGYVNFAQPFDRELIGKIRGPTILHICGDGTKVIDEMLATGATCLSIDSKTDARHAVQASRGRAAIMGNIDTVYALAFGTPEEVAAETKRAVEAGMDIIAPGCAISPLTPNKNLRAMVETVKSLG
ncbi:MtaA/CmuA family methyltransferase [Candidatus Pyrohabitans sp.]